MREILLRGRRLRLVDDKPTFWDKAAAGQWEPETLDAIEEMVRPGLVFLDIGAWVGPAALFAAALGARVVAIEPDPAAFAALEGNVAANPDLAAGMTLVQRAAAPEEGMLRLGAPRKLGDSMGSQWLADRTAHGFTAKSMTPEAIAAILPDGPLALKIDIEGGEYALLPAMRPLLPRLKHALIAFHPALARRVGQDEAALRRWNQQALALFSGFEPHMLDRGEAGEAPEMALARNCAIRFDRMGGSGSG